MKIATWNVNSLAVRLPQLLDWLALHQPDVLCLQETKLSDDKFPHAQINAAGYQVQWFGQKTYNGVALVSKLPALDVVRNIPGHDDAQARVIAGTVNDVRIVGVYVPNGQSVESEKFPYKLTWLTALRDWIAKEQALHPQLALLGDYNIAPEDRDSFDPEGLRETIHHTTEERDHFRKLVELGMCDGFRLFEQPEKSYSWWDYRMLGYQKNRGLRIDHILVSESLKPHVKGCAIDRTPRKWKQPSDHAPVTVEI